MAKLQLSGSRWDLIIVGAGIAGAFLAYRMATLGYSVLLVEKEPFGRSKVCGGCLNADGTAILRGAGLGAHLDALYSPTLKSMQLSRDSMSIKIPIPGGMAVSRAQLDRLLTEQAISKGATFVPETVALSAERDSDRITVQLKQGEDHFHCHAKVVVSAEGLSGTFLQKVLGGRPRVAENSLIGAGTSVILSQSSFNPGTIYMAAGSLGYLGIVLTGYNCLTLAAALNVSELKENGGVGGCVKALFESADFPEICEWENLRWKGTVLLTREATRVADERIFAVGDAASYIEPFSGEGMTWALHSVQALIPILQEAILKWEPHHATEWQSRYSEVIRPMQTRAKMMASLLRKPLLCRTALHLVRAFPALATPFTYPRARAY